MLERKKEGGKEEAGKQGRLRSRQTLIEQTPRFPHLLSQRKALCQARMARKKGTGTVGGQEGKERLVLKNFQVEVTIQEGYLTFQSGGKWEGEQKRL